MKILNNFIETRKDKRCFAEHDIKALLKEMGLAVPKGIFVHINEQIPQPLPLTYPLVAKISSPGISSKSDVNGVRLGLKNENALRQAASELSGISGAEGVLIEEMAAAGIEVIVGGLIDNQFGPVVMFGIGGIFVELFKDVAFALAPLTKTDTIQLVRQVRGYRLLEGYRGTPAIDMDALITVITAASELIATGLIKEIDLNPVTLYPGGAMILDAKMTAGPAA